MAKCLLAPFPFLRLFAIAMFVFIGTGNNEFTRELELFLWILFIILHFFTRFRFSTSHRPIFHIFQCSFCACCFSNSVHFISWIHSINFSGIQWVKTNRPHQVALQLPAVTLKGHHFRWPLQQIQRFTIPHRLKTTRCRRDWKWRQHQLVLWLDPDNDRRTAVKSSSSNSKSDKLPATTKMGAPQKWEVGTMGTTTATVDGHRHWKRSNCVATQLCKCLEQFYSFLKA